VALARVVLRNPSVLLLDEATNALDAEAEMHIKLALDSFGRGRTVVAIAHRLSSLSGADVIVVLDHGTVAEIGAPDVLLNQRGRFAELYELQAGEWPRQAS
jgi:ABC-type multidrug transport system fused ATPase/permease subunit